MLKPRKLFAHILAGLLFLALPVPSQAVPCGSYKPPAETGDIYFVIAYKRESGPQPSGGHAVPTTCSIDWGAYHTGTQTVVPSSPSDNEGFVVKMRHLQKDSYPLSVSTNGNFLKCPKQGDPPAEWSSSKYKKINL